MSVRGVWVIVSGGNRSTGNVGEKKAACVFSRRYPTVERRARLQLGSLYCPLPSDSDLMTAVITLCTQTSTEFTVERDSCASVHRSPVYELMGGNLWPVVVIERNGLLFVGLPLVDHRGERRPIGLQVPSVPCVLALLDSMAQITADTKSQDEQMVKLSQYLSLMAPFGTPLDMNSDNARLKLQQSKGNPLPISKQKVPSWRPGVYSGPPRVQLCVTEEVRAQQYDKKGVTDTWDLTGTVTCKAELEGSPDIQVTLTTPPDKPGLDHLVLHPIVHAGDAHQTNRKLRFSAPLDSVNLVHYQYPVPSALPIRGFYQMKSDREVRLLVQLKLNDTVRNNFEYCEVNIPFFNRGAIDKVDSIVPVTLSPSLAISLDRKSIVWNIGQRFPTKGLELSLQAVVHFKENSSEDNPFYVRSNSYIDVYFKVLDYTLSGCCIDSKSVTLFPSSRTKLTINRELIASRYRIWNSHGDVIATYPQLRTLQT